MKVDKNSFLQSHWSINIKVTVVLNLTLDRQWAYLLVFGHKSACSGGTRTESYPVAMKTRHANGEKDV